MEINKIFIVGSGFMGAGIAQTAISKGFEVKICDLSLELAQKAAAGIDKMLTKMVTKGKMTQEDKDAAMARLSACDSFDAAADADLVIEAVTENVDVKKSVFEKISAVAKEDAILATNTSSISVAEISKVVKNPQRFLGMHFFSPVPLMKLLELVRALATSDATIAVAKEVGQRLGKVCIVAKDSPAFIVNRLLDPMINEAIFMVDEGTASIEDIDNGAKYGLNHPMGPLELIDMAGIDIELAVMEVMHRETGDDKYRPSLLLRNMVRLGWLGRKTGKGFYVYPEDGSKPYPNPDL